MIHLDTHVALWYFEGYGNLGSRTKQRIEACLKAGEVALSAIVFWEVALLKARSRVPVDIPVARWRTRLQEWRVSEIPLSGDIGIQSVALKQLHADPADRFIVATALAHGATLVTADRQLLDWHHPGFHAHDASL